MCDRTIDPLAASPWEPSLLFGVDIVSAFFYGLILSVLIQFIASIAKRITLLPHRMIDYFMLWAPFIIVSLTLSAFDVMKEYPTTGCRP
jgi:hypothetical protein